MDKKELNVSREIFKDWEDLLTLLASKASIPCALIMRIDLPDIKVCVSSRTKDNPYNVGDKETLEDSGLYCEGVFKTRKELLVGNALKDPDWENNPDIKLGMISYFGFPLLWPDKEIFGTVCVLDSKENFYDKGIEAILREFKKYVESCLDLLIAQHLFEKEAGDKKALKEELKKKQRLSCVLLEKVSEMIPNYKLQRPSSGRQ